MIGWMLEMELLGESMKYTQHALMKEFFCHLVAELQNAACLCV